MPSGPAEWSDKQLMLVLDGKQPDRRGVTSLHTTCWLAAASCSRESRCVSQESCQV